MPLKKKPTRLKIAATPVLYVFDTTAGKIVASVLSKNSESYALSWAASLTFKPKPLDGGRRFNIEAELMGLVGVGQLYQLSRAGVRGYVLSNEPWLLDVYGRFVQRAQAGAFRLNPYAKTEAVTLAQGDGEVSGETVVVSTINANEPAAKDPPNA